MDADCFETIDEDTHLHI